MQTIKTLRSRIVSKGNYESDLSMDQSNFQKYQIKNFEQNLIS
jgi:hypothetical protein